MSEDFTKEELIKFVSFDPQTPSPSADYFWENRKNNFKATWVAALFGSYWMLYRRMYFMFILFYFVIGYALTFFFQSLGYDRGAAGTYSSLIDNVLIVLLGHFLFMHFLKRNIHKKVFMPPHVRLFMPIAMLLRNLLLLLLIQIFGVWWNYDALIKGIYPFVYFFLGYTVLMYIYYFIDWLKTRHA